MNTQEKITDQLNNIFTNTPYTHITHTWDEDANLILIFRTPTAEIRITEPKISKFATSVTSAETKEVSCHIYRKHLLGLLKTSSGIVRLRTISILTPTLSQSAHQRLTYLYNLIVEKEADKRLNKRRKEQDKTDRSILAALNIKP